MTNEMFAHLSRSAQEQYLIEQDILSGKYGQPGDPFITTRALAEQRQVSVVTAHNILTELCTSGYIELRGKRYYLSHAKLAEAHNNQTNILGLMVPHLNNEFFSSLTDAVIEAARQRGYRTLVISASYSAAEEKAALQLLMSLNVAGIINAVVTPPENEYLYRKFPVPCITLGHSLDKGKISAVLVNSFSISQKVTRHLLEEGYRSFLYIGAQNVPLENDVRFAGFQMELHQNGYTLDAGHTFRISMDSPVDDSALIRLIKDQTGPVGVFCYHDLIAAQVYRVCGQAGLRIPEDVGIVGFDDLSIATSLTPPLTTIQYRIASMADMTLNLLLARIQTPNTPYDNYYVEPNLVIRGSSMLTKT